MLVNYIPFKKAPIKSNCPECFATDALTIHFSHKKEEHRFFERSTDEIKSEITCSHCKTIIYPARWTEDIERVRDYHLKLAEPPKGYFKLKFPW